MDWIYEKRVTSFDEMSDLPQDLRKRLGGGVRLSAARNSPRPRLGGHDAEISVPVSGRKSDRVRPHSGLAVALRRATSDRRTICVSTQVGCAYGCKFCASGLDGFSRNLDASEIVQQLLAVEKASGEKIDNVVFMGMGEPLANFANVIRAIRIINAPWGMEIGARHITVSTSGLAPQIRKLADEPLQSRLAISLHGATDEVRNQDHAGEPQV